MNMDVKILYKIFAKRMQQYIKRIVYLDEEPFLLLLQSWFTILKSISVIITRAWSRA